MTEEVLTLADITTRFDSEWILLEDPVRDRGGQITGGKVVWHSKDRDEVYQKAVELRLKHSAFHYTGEIPEDMVIVL